MSCVWCSRWRPMATASSMGKRSLGDVSRRESSVSLSTSATRGNSPSPSEFDEASFDVMSADVSYLARYTDHIRDKDMTRLHSAPKLYTRLVSVTPIEELADGSRHQRLIANCLVFKQISSSASPSGRSMSPPAMASESGPESERQTRRSVTVVAAG
ncbi:hypothetical protein BDV96DRAFT_385439 [Lophiotrema nucula]|uniref:Uncharacterized protein n=1 Tax=Lophiotrema nucula TaxID=690887 RepID=A0A6A5ZGQ7_9PLEO|nr:hypothetical protein BDV96DRAFT_385439 [Lophiotrema nucula]